MSILIQNEAAIASLSAASGPEEVRDPGGRLLGHFIPSTKKKSCTKIGLADAALDRPVNDAGDSADEYITKTIDE